MKRRNPSRAMKRAWKTRHLTKMTDGRSYDIIDDPDGPCVLMSNRITLRHHWRRIHGPVPKGLMLCHRCDQATCRNLGHIWLGTALDNVRDCIAKGRFKNPPVHRGLEHHLARVTPALARRVRSLFDSTRTGVTRRYGTTVRRYGTMTISDIATRFNISHSIVKRILSGEHYACKVSQVGSSS